MRNYSLSVLLIFMIFFSSCNDQNEIINGTDDFGTSNLERLHFQDEAQLENMIEGIATRTTYQKPSGFVSLMSIKDHVRSGEEMTYYEALGYDSLVPNERFAELLNIKGELSVGNKIIRITPEGTYVFDIEYKDDQIDNFLNAISVAEIKANTDSLIVFSDKVSLIKTFRLIEGDYEMTDEGDVSEMEDEYFDSLTATRATNEPDDSTFQVFSANRGGVFGKLIQSIIGSNKASTINYSKKRRLKGSFYFYNYGVYSEIGAKGWTDKKNWIGWSKTESDELRVSWKNIVIKTTMPDYYKQSWDEMRKVGQMGNIPANNDGYLQYFPPQNITINNRRITGITITVTDVEANKIKNMFIKQGAKPAYNYLKGILRRPASEVEGTEAVVIAGRTEMFVVYNLENVTKYNCKNYTHVFSQTWMTILLGWNNSGGFNINGVGQSNIQKPSAYTDALNKAFKERKPQLVSGEVIVCARLGTVWKGMKIVKD